MTTGCLVRVTVTAAVYPCLVVSHHVDMQSTGQKSCCFSTLSGQRNALFQQNIGFPLPVPVRGTEFHGEATMIFRKPTHLYPQGETHDLYPYLLRFVRMHVRGMAQPRISVKAGVASTKDASKRASALAPPCAAKTLAQFPRNRAARPHRAPL